MRRCNELFCFLSISEFALIISADSQLNKRSQKTCTLYFFGAFAISNDLTGSFIHITSVGGVYYEPPTPSVPHFQTLKYTNIQKLPIRISDSRSFLSLISDSLSLVGRRAFGVPNEGVGVAS